MAAAEMDVRVHRCTCAALLAPFNSIPELKAISYSGVIGEIGNLCYCCALGQSKQQREETADTHDVTNREETRPKTVRRG